MGSGQGDLRGDVVTRYGATSRRAAILGITVLLTATLVRMFTLSLTGAQLAAEIGLGLAVAAYAGFCLAALSREWRANDLFVILQGAVPALVAAAMLAVAAANMDQVGVIAVLVYAAVVVGVPPGAALHARLASVALTEGIFATVWLVWLAGDVPTLLFALAFITGLELLVLSHASAALVTAEARNMRSTAHAATAERVGTSIDVLGVNRAILEATAQSFPLATHAVLLLHDAASDRLRPLPLYLSPTGIRALEADNIDFSVGAGESLAGKVFSSSRPMLWPTAHDVAFAQGDRGEHARARAGASRVGVTRCAVGAPLVIDDEVIGAYIVTSTRRELVWDEDDVTVVAALASEAARALERARRYERELDQAHLDSITGLANHRQLTRTLDKEVARARRLETSLGVVFCDLDLFKMVNDTYGHAAGDRVLTILARVLHESLRREDSAARYGGDEFVCVLPGADRSEADAVGRRISTGFELRVREDAELSHAGLTISCGVAIFPDDAKDVDGLLQHADAAMRRVKLSHRKGASASVRAS